MKSKLNEIIQANEELGERERNLRDIEQGKVHHELVAGFLKERSEKYLTLYADYCREYEELLDAEEKYNSAYIGKVAEEVQSLMDTIGRLAALVSGVAAENITRAKICSVDSDIISARI